MNRKNHLLWVAAAGVLIFSTVAGAQPLSLEQLAAKAIGGLARLRFKIDNPMMTSPQQSIGQCICIDAGKGIFMTRDIPANVPADEFKDVTLTVPGIGGKKFKASLVGTDRRVGISFVKVIGPHPWKALKVESRTDLKLGQRVVSVGLMGPTLGNQPYVGTAIVAARIRVPDDSVHVTGGNLANSSSPVLTADGRLVGLVGRQLPEEMRMRGARGRWTDVPMISRAHTRYFTVVDEFAFALKGTPTAGKFPRLAWMGVASFQHILPEQAEVMKLGDLPAVRIGQVIPDGPADKAGIKQGDLIVAIDGRPLQRLGSPRLTARQFDRTIGRMKAGTEVALTRFKDEKTEVVKLRLAEMPLLPYEALRYYDREFGFAGRDLVLFDKHLNQPDQRKDKGVLVTVVRRDSVAGRAKLLPGDLITSIEEDRVTSVAGLRAAMTKAAKADPGKSIRFVIRRGTEPKALMVALPVVPK